MLYESQLTRFRSYATVLVLCLSSILSCYRRVCSYLQQ